MFYFLVIVCPLFFVWNLYGNALFLLEFCILTTTVFKVPEEPKKMIREERVPIAVPKRKVSPPLEGTPAHGLICEQTSLKQYDKSLKPNILAHFFYSSSARTTSTYLKRIFVKQ